MQNWLTKRWIDVTNLFGDLADEQASAAKQMAEPRQPQTIEQPHDIESVLLRAENATKPVHA